MKQTKSKLVALLLVILSQGVFSQVYNKKIKMISDQFTSPVPRGYMVRIYGPIEQDVNFLKLTISQDGNNDIYYWKRANDLQTEFELLITKPLKRDANFTYRVQKGYDTIGTKTANLMMNQAPEVKLMSDTPPTDGTKPPPNETSRWGLVSGFGCAFLGRGESRSQDMFGYVAAKFMFSKRVDKNVVDAETGLKNRTYKTIGDRFSLMVGGAVTPIAYKGKELTSPVYDVKPMVGLCFDFSPEVSLDAGTLFYKYQPGNSSLNNDLDSKLGVGLYMSVSVDIDVFTRLKLALLGKSYSKTENQ